MSDIYVVVHIATTCDESTTYVTKDSAELIEFAWSVVDATTLENTHLESVLVRPINTPITQYCSKLHKITWEHVRNAGSFKDAMAKFDSFMQENVILKNKEFSLITFDVSKIRVQLPREARDKSVVLPPYLQHPRIFDIQSEYSKWQISHPEALSYTASSLSNIVTALEVEVDNAEGSDMPPSSTSTPPPTSTSSVSSTSSASFFSEPLANVNLNSHSNLNSNSNLNLSAPQETKTSTTTNVYTKILIQLIKKSLPLEDHPSVLTKPYDSAQDVKVFLLERSKILYLSNLPGDTTQSELESWFTQYGGRPIAFWTLKNIDANDKSGKNNNGNNNGNNGLGGKQRGTSGFAVFATHEEATESLSMNGRVLTDRAIEVQASSASVLDKARDLLTPFPPSKNRPRPGDWTCPSCGFSNFQRRTACFRCSFPAASAVTIQESMFSGNPMNTRRNNSSNSMQGNSNTDKISLNTAVVNAAAAALNPNQHYNTNFQDSNFASHHKLGANGLNGSNHQHVNSHSHYNGHNNGHNHNNNGNNSRPHYGNNVPFRAGDWKCSNDSCQYHNFAKNLCCLKCGNAKHASSQNHNGNNNNNSHMHSVNSTAAAIAAATASGQPLNLTNGFMGLQLPQPLHANHSQAQTQGSHGQHRHNTNSSGNGYYNNKSQFPVHISNQGANANLRGISGTPPQLLAQQLAMLQQHQQHQQHHHHHQQQQGQKQAAQPKFSQSVSNSPGMYANFGPLQTGYPSYNKNVPHPPHSAPVNGDATSVKNGSLENLNPTLNVLANQISSLNLNGNQQ